VFRGVRDALERSGNRVILAVSDADEPTDQHAVGSLIEARVGVIIAATLMLPDVERCARSIGREYLLGGFSMEVRVGTQPSTSPAEESRNTVCDRVLAPSSLVAQNALFRRSSSRPALTATPRMPKRRAELTPERSSLRSVRSWRRVRARNQ